MELEDEEDILGCGIEIKAQPPGKTLKTISLLSGGEKALTAISLLFAIQNLKPSPFCLLDEIEAALDDSNVNRFEGYLHKLIKNTQFIVITHRRGTMVSADRLYGITMENHQPFDPEKFNYECQIGVTSESLGEEDMAIVRVMLEGITRADQALGDLTDALRESEEPTIVVFFGDHRPNLFMTDGDTVYTKLGLCPDNDTVGWTPEEISDLYSTDYLIWANDAALLQGQAGTRRDSSITAIGPQLLELTGQPVTRYWALMEQVSQVCRTNTELYFVDGTGTPSAGVEEAALSDEARELLQLREDVLYDAMYGQQYITAEMNEPVQ